MKNEKIHFRASKISTLINKGRGHALTQTGQRYIIQQWLQDKYGIRRSVSSKEIDKGRSSEEDAITLYGQVTNQLLVKNAKRVRKDLVQGEADVILDDQIIDIKCPWDAETFMLADLSNEYEWQLRAYMFLYDKPTARLAYCLMDLPDSLYQGEYRKFCWNNNIIDDSLPEYDDLIAQFDRSVMFTTNPKISASDRVKVFDIERDAGQEERMLDRLKIAAEFYESLTLGNIKEILTTKSE